MPETLLPISSPGRSGNFLYSLLHVFLPAVCPVCGRLGRVVCEGCLMSQLRLTRALCVECGGFAPCALHRSSPYCYAGTSYDGVNREIVHVMKYRNGRSAALLMGRLLAGAIAKPNADFIVPVPLHRESEREYNQAELIARGAGRLWGIPVRPLLAWKRRVRRQAHKQGGELRALPRDAIVVKSAPGVGASAFLVDDVFTTGSTMRAARDALLRAGVRMSGAMVWSGSEGRLMRPAGGNADEA